MFEQTFLTGAVRTRRAWTVPVCFLGQLAVVGGLVLLPLVFFEGIPAGRLAPQPLLAPSGPPPAPHSVVQLVATPRSRVRPAFVEPTDIPRGVARVVDRAPEPPAEAYNPCGADCVVGALPTVGLPPVGVRVLPPKPDETPRRAQVTPPTVRPPVAAPVRISQGVQEAMLIRRVTPIYPHLAILTRTSGVVHLEAVIGTDGRIRELRVLDGHPMLTQAALDAVERWVYRPTMLNGSPVEVLTEITVNFSLSAR